MVWPVSEESQNYYLPTHSSLQGKCLLTVLLAVPLMSLWLLGYPLAQAGQMLLLSEICF